MFCQSRPREKRLEASGIADSPSPGVCSATNPAYIGDPHSLTNSGVAISVAIPAVTPPVAASLASSRPWICCSPVGGGGARLASRAPSGPVTSVAGTQPRATGSRAVVPSSCSMSRAVTTMTASVSSISRPGTITCSPSA